MAGHYLFQVAEGLLYLEVAVCFLSKEEEVEVLFLAVVVRFLWKEEVEHYLL